MLKHIGRMAKNQRKVVVAYKVVPNEPENCIVVTTENLMADEHDSLMKLVESPAGQEAEDLALAMSRTILPDGRNMLAAFHSTGKMVKVATNDVEMTPNTRTTIKLSELNELIAQQKGITVADLALGNEAKKRPEVSETQITSDEVVTQTTDTSVLTDEQLAAQYRSQADSLYKEAKRLRDEAEKLAPTKKKAAKTVESA